MSTDRDIVIMRLEVCMCSCDKPVFAVFYVIALLQVHKNGSFLSVNVCCFVIASGILAGCLILCIAVLVSLTVTSNLTTKQPVLTEIENGLLSQCTIMSTIFQKLTKI